MKIVQSEEAAFRKRLCELSARSRSRGVYTRTDFLTLAQQSALHALYQGGTLAEFACYGGFPHAERVIAVFGSEADCGYAYTPEIVCLKIAPRAEKFGEPLAHRDVLGAALSLGVKRELTGDILIDGKTAYLIAAESIADYIAENLQSVRHTDVVCTPTDGVPDGLCRPPEPHTFISSSERLDCIISSVYNISRSAAKELFDRERVFVNGSLRLNPSAQPKENDVISVRGTGRFLYLGAESQTKKGRLKISVGVFR